ncbi:MAG: hypothetical protein A2Z20_07580 [Bdellovibrionales bacterium RBG_16_40_8]|nr:MAG: hypothetical protein A2Z20_07580 [Bdellovibrionales bacterium RBG_16_40_8]
MKIQNATKQKKQAQKILKKTTLLLFLSATVFIFSCTKKSKVDYDLDISETLRWHVATEPPSLDWTIATDTTSSHITGLLMEGLTRHGFKAAEVTTEPNLAMSWESSKDMKTWTFSLRQDVKWTDGVAFTAQQIIDGWERLLNPKTGAEYANFLFNVKNARAYLEGNIKDFKQVGVSINDKGQLIVALEAAQSYFPSILAHHSTFPIRKDLIEKYAGKWTEPGNHVGLGAYKLKIWDHDKAVVLERNENYFGKKPKIKYVLGRIITELSTALNMFKIGDLDVVDDFPSPEVRMLRDTKEYRLFSILAVYYLGLNVKRPPLDNVKVRRALSMAIDREEINNILEKEKIPAYNIVPPGLLGHDANIGLKFEPETAKKILDDAGYQDRSKFPRLQFGFNSSENHQRIAENIQAQLKRNLGLGVELVNEEWKTYLKSLQANTYQMFRMAWVGDYPDADTFIGLMVTDGGNNRTQWGNKRYDELVKLGVSESDKEKRKQIYFEAQRILNEQEVPIIPIYYYRAHRLVNARIKNYPQNVMDKFDLDDTEIIK